jgi:hypothetical protein
MSYIITVRWGYATDQPELTKHYLVSAFSDREARAEFFRRWGYNPGVPVRADLAGPVLPEIHPLPETQHEHERRVEQARILDYELRTGERD